MILEATAFGAASYILIGSESTPSCFDDMIHGTGGHILASGRREGTETRPGPKSVRWWGAQAEDDRWAGNIYSQGGGREQAERGRRTFI